ncbi:MAG: hypothetical protein M1376_11760 [Planctomycetes bacterium]|nr:hypothetical protein [Planctomycetota bacterium]
MTKPLIITLLVLTLPGTGTARTSREEIGTLADALSWLQQESRRMVRASQRTMKDGTAAFPPQVGIGYEAFWLRDYVYTLEGTIDAYSDKELLDACRLFVRSLRSDGAGVDCVKFDGTPIYMPGYGTMGQNPVADGSQFTVAVVWHTYRRTKDGQLLRESLEPLLKTMNAVPRNPDTSLVHIRPGEPWDRCPYGFTDTIHKEGDELFCSLLYVQASRQLADLLNWAGRAAEAESWKQQAERVAASIRRVLWDPQAGLFRAAAICCREHDIWGSAFAVYLGVANDAQAKRIATLFQRDYSGLVQNGQIRHLLPHVYWEKGCPRDTYQNGGFWATPTGWFIYTLDLVDPALADRTVIALVKDFQSGDACEWVFKDVRRLPNYLASATLPLAGIRAMIERRQSLRNSNEER